MSTVVSEATQILEGVFGVCLTAEVLGSVMAVVESVKGAQFVGGYQEYITTGKEPQFTPVLKDARVCVAVIDCDVDLQSALDTMSNLQTLLPGKIRLIAVRENPDASFLLRAVRAGCSEILTKPLVADELTSALVRFQAVGGAAPVQVGKAIALVGSKGGVGTSTLAVHLAQHLVKTHGKRVLLVDQKHQLGHLSLYLGIKQPKYHFSELLQNADRLDAPLLEGLITNHSAGLDLIASPQVCSPRYNAPAAVASSIVSFLRQRYDVVLLDVEPESSEWFTGLMKCCDEVDIVCTPDVASLRDLARHIEYLSLTEGCSSKLRIILNRAGTELSVPTVDIERATRLPVSVEVPNNTAELMKALNAGDPIPATSKGKFSQALSKWARTIAADPTESLQTPSKKRLRLW